MEQRWQDLANLLSLPGGLPAGPGAQHQPQHPDGMHPHHPHHHHHHPHQHYGYDAVASAPARSVVLHNATLAPPVGDLNSSSVYSGLSMGNAVAQSMNLTNSSEPMGDGSPAAAFKLEPPQDMMYYQNSTSGADMSQLAPLNSSTEGFLSSILNDEDLQLMDMMNDSMYPLRMLDSGGVAAGAPPGVLPGAGAGLMGGPTAGAAGVTSEERLDASSDSAVSSMGSERVASLSDGGEWMETSSDSGHTEHYHLDCKYRGHGQVPSCHGPATPHHPPGHPPSHTPTPHDYGSYSPHRVPAQPAGVAQKKHQMFGKRYFQGEQATGGLPVGPAAPSMATPMPLKLDFGGDTARAVAPHPQSVAQSVAQSVPLAMSGAVSGVPGVPGAASAFSSPLPMEDEELRAHEVKFGYYGHDFPRQHPARPSMEPVAHNHTYHLPSPLESTGAIQRPLQRDKPKSRDSRKSEDGHLSRDEKRARALNVPLAVDDIINLPMDEFNERLSKHDLSEAQLSLIRDIRRRGKNKVAAQNCRKRKLDQIVTLADEVQQMRSRKQKLLREHDYLNRETALSKEKFSQLYRHVFSALRDADGNPYSPYEYSLQQGPEGNVMLVPLASSSGALVDPAHQQMSRSVSDAAASHSFTRTQIPQHQSDRHKEQQSQHQQHPHGAHNPHQTHHPNSHPPYHPHPDPHHKE